MDNAFLGLNGFIWWIGVVENNNDPLKIGRCQVRIFGWHTDDKNLIPTADLPWSHAVLPINNSKCFSVPSMGDWVNGYFFDGKSGQFPAYFGVLPGVISTNVNKNQTQGFTDPSTSGAVTTVAKESKDGSGTTFKDKPFVTNPQLPGIPSTNLAAVNSKVNPPPSVVDKIADQTIGIGNVNAQSCGVDMAAAATAGAAGSPKPTGVNGIPAATNPCGLDTGSVLTDIKAFIKPATDILGNTVTYVTGLEAKAETVITGAITSTANTINSATSAIGGAITSASNKLNTMLAKAQEEVDFQINRMETAAAEALSEAEASLKKTVGDLSVGAGDVGCIILAGLTGLSPAKVTVKQPVVVDPKSGTAKVVIAPSVSIPANVSVPNDISSIIPVNQAPGNKFKSLENSISLWKQCVVHVFHSLIQANKTTDINTYKFMWQELENKIIEIGDTYQSPETITDLTIFWNPYNTRILAKHI
jgi:hypothetical protein